MPSLYTKYILELYMVPLKIRCYLQSLFPSKWMYVCSVLSNSLQPTPVFLPGESQGQGSLVGCSIWGCTESDTTEETSQQQSCLTLCDPIDGSPQTPLSMGILQARILEEWDAMPISFFLFVCFFFFGCTGSLLLHTSFL